MKTGQVVVVIVETLPTTPQDVEVGGGQVFIHIAIIGGCKGAEQPDDCPHLFPANSLHLFQELLLGKHTTLKDVSEGISIIHVLFVKHNDHSQVILHASGCSFELYKVIIAPSILLGVHGLTSVVQTPMDGQVDCYAV